MEKPVRKRKIPSALRWIMWVILVQLILFNISAAFYAYKLTHFYDDPSLQEDRPEGNVFSKTWKLFSGPRFPRSQLTQVPGFPVDTVSFTTGNGIYIDAWYGKADSLARGTVILFHGVTVSKSNVLTEAAEFRDLGYHVLLIDFRGHGNSSGYNTTLGFREAEEVKLAYDYVAGLGEKRIFLWGSSMGAVAIAKALSDHNLQPAGVILEMPFASLQTHLKARARMFGFSGFPEKPFSFFVTWWIGVQRGFGGFKHKTTKYVQKISCPVLLQWGALDEAVLKAETDAVYEQIAATDKKLVLYPTAYHESMLIRDPLKWRIEVSRFLERSSL